MELNVIRQADPQVADAIEAELNRQRSHIELIASENFVSPAVMAAMGSVPDEQVRGRVSRASATTAAASTSTWWKTSPCDRAKQLFRLLSTSTCSRIPARRRIRRCTSPCSSRATRVMGMSLSERRPSDARQPGQPVRQVLPCRSLRRRRATGCIDYDARASSWRWSASRR